MKKLLITIGILANQLLGYPQQFINGDLNTISQDLIQEEYLNMVTDGWNSTFVGASWYGTAKIAYYSNEYFNNNTAASISFSYENVCWYSNLSMKLDEPLIPGVTYKLIYEEKFDLDTPMKIELSHFQNTPGVEIGQTSDPNVFLQDWRENQIEFTATEAFQYFNFILDYEAASFYNGSRCLDKFHLEIVNNPFNGVEEQIINPILKYDVYTFDGKLISRQMNIAELSSGSYILVSGNNIYKLIK